MAMVVSIFGYNLAVGDADFRSPGLLRRPLRVGEDNNRAEVAVYPHSVPLRFCSQFRHALDVGHDCFLPIENCPRDVDKLLHNVRGLWFL